MIAINKRDAIHAAVSDPVKQAQYVQATHPCRALVGILPGESTERTAKVCRDSRACPARHLLVNPLEDTDAAGPGGVYPYIAIPCTTNRKGGG